jgi:hypothetical protein
MLHLSTELLVCLGLDTGSVNRVSCLGCSDSELLQRSVSTNATFACYITCWQSVLFGAREIYHCKEINASWYYYKNYCYLLCHCDVFPSSGSLRMRILVDCSPLKMETTRFTKTFVTTHKSTWRWSQLIVSPPWKPQIRYRDLCSWYFFFNRPLL